MDVFFPVLFWPSLILLGITAGPLCPLGCVGGSWKPQIRRIRVVEQPGSSDHRLGGWSCRALGKLQPLGAAQRSSCPERSHKWGACVLWELALCFPCRGSVSYQAQIRMVFTWKMMSLVTGGRLLTAEIAFQEESVEILSFLFGKCWVSANHWAQWKRQLCEQRSWNEEKLMLI